MTEEHKTYLGDSVYAAVEGGMIKLTTENGMRASNTIYLEQEVYEALVEYVDGLRKRAAEGEL